MKGSQKSKRVSWATNGNLCQVKVFRSDDYPWKIRIGTQTNLELKMKSSLKTKPDDGLPPGFEGVFPKTRLSKNKSVQTKWRCPPKIELSPSWRVAFGEESEEVQTQNQLESRLFEAVYPRPSNIPPNPILSLDAREIDIDDSTTPLVPMTPIEEEETREEVDCVQPQLQANTTKDALSAMLSSNIGHEKLIDPELLVKILTNPTTLEQLVKLQRNRFASQNVTLTSQTPTQPNEPKMPSFTVISKDLVYPSMPNIDKPYQHHQPIVSSHTTISTPAIKDMNYYKSLIQQHGVEKQQNAIHPQSTSYEQAGSNPTPTPLGTKELKPKLNKACVYFKSSKGCRHGANCAYQHDSSFLKRATSILEMQSAKRMKTIDRVITGSQIYG